MTFRPVPILPDLAGPRKGVVLPFLLVALIWGSTWFVIKDQIRAAPPGWTVTWRFLLAGAGMFALARWRGDSLRLPPGARRIAVLVGLAQFCGNFQFVYRAEHWLTSGLVAVIYALLMVPNALIARAVHGHRLSARFLAGSAVAIGGIALLLVHELAMAPAGAAIGPGIAFALAGLLCASLANVAQGSPSLGPVPATSLLAWAMAWGTLANAGLALLLEGPPPPDPGLRYWAGIAYLALAGSVVAFPLYFLLIRRLGAGRAAYNGVAVPVVAMGLSTLLEGYRWTMLAALGAALALAGLLIALSRRA